MYRHIRPEVQNIEGKKLPIEGNLRIMDIPVAPVWTRRGLVIKPGLLGPGWSRHCQMPTPYALDRDTIRLFFCSRDDRNRSHIFRADLSAVSPWQLKDVSAEPILAPGPVGAFDAAGVMPTALVEMGDELWMYYIGWSQRADVPYHNAIGIVRSLDKGRTFERFLPGPVIGTGPYEPYFCGTGDIARIGDQWIMWYMSTTEWRIVQGKPEPRYHLKQAYSRNGIHWDHGHDVAIDYISEDEGGIARATILPVDDGYWMWFCYRGISGYRSTGEQAYRLGIAWSSNGTTWQRLPRQKVFTENPNAENPSDGDFDSFMECYPAVFQSRHGICLFYNGSDFGQTGIGLATLQKPRDWKAPAK